MNWKKKIFTIPEKRVLVEYFVNYLSIKNKYVICFQFEFGNDYIFKVITDYILLINIIV